MKRFSVKKTKGNVVLLFVIGLLLGVVIGLNEPEKISDPVQSPVPEVSTVSPDFSQNTEAENAIKLGAESPVQ